MDSFVNVLNRKKRKEKMKQFLLTRCHCFNSRLNYIKNAKSFLDLVNNITL